MVSVITLAENPLCIILLKWYWEHILLTFGFRNWASIIRWYNLFSERLWYIYLLINNLSSLNWRLCWILIFPTLVNVIIYRSSTTVILKVVGSILKHLKRPITNFIYTIDEVNWKVWYQLLYHKIFISALP